MVQKLLKLDIEIPQGTRTYMNGIQRYRSLVMIERKQGEKEINGNGEEEIWYKMSMARIESSLVIRNWTFNRTFMSHLCDANETRHASISK